MGATKGGMIPLQPIFKKAYWSLAAAGAIYTVFILCLTNLTLQRHALYANKLVTAWWASVDTPQAYGFGKNQVTPFRITTPDHEDLYAWHVLPLNVYGKHEEELAAEVPASLLDREHAETKAFKLLTEDPKARLVINLHGNAGHIAQGWRTDTYRALASQPNTHVLTVDYRGFGRSTGSPTEAGIIADATALVSYALHTLAIPPHRIVILGQSLGTAVASAVGLQFADPAAAARLLPTSPLSTATSEDQEAGADGASVTMLPEDPVDFAAVILVAPFTNIPVLVETYRMFGWIPLLSPVRYYTRVSQWLTAHIADTWDTVARVEALVNATAAPSTAGKAGGRTLRFHVIHAKDDFDIRWTHGEAVFNAAKRTLLGRDEGAEVREAVLEADGGRSTAVRSVRSSSGRQEVRFDLVAYGNHNRVVTFTPVTLAVNRAFDAAEQSA